MNTDITLDSILVPPRSPSSPVRQLEGLCLRDVSFEELIHSMTAAASDSSTSGRVAVATSSLLQPPAEVAVDEDDQENFI